MLNLFVQSVTQQLLPILGLFLKRLLSLMIIALRFYFIDSNSHNFVLLFITIATILTADSLLPFKSIISLFKYEEMETHPFSLPFLRFLFLYIKHNLVYNK